MKIKEIESSFLEYINCRHEKNESSPYLAHIIVAAILDHPSNLQRHYEELVLYGCLEALDGPPSRPNELLLRG
jgi:hypothetical protein